MRTLFVSTLALMLSTAWQPVQAEFVLLFSEPTGQYEIRVVDNGGLDQATIRGFIEYSHNQGGLDVYVTARSKPDAGSVTAPDMELRVDYVGVAGDLIISMTDTDFSVGFATVYTETEGLIQHGSFSFDYFGDSGNQEFGFGFPIRSIGPFDSPDSIVDQSEDIIPSGSLSPEGSLTISLTLTPNAGDAPLARAGAINARLLMVPEDVNVPVPDVTGLELQAAEAAIEAAGLEVGSTSTQLSDTVPAGNVIKQTPEGGDSVPPGTAVDLVVSAGNDFEQVANQAGLAGLWYDPAFDGEGFNVIVADGSWLLYYYGWRSNGQRLWLLSETAVDPILFGKSVTLDLFIAVRGTFADPNPELSRWGEITFIFDTCTSGRAHLQGEDGSKTTALVKLLGIDALDCDS